ncbi:O-linked N-acetylglucosamine transferase, SPINDLY family protein [Nodularia spumigena]|jgi:predicted O-linked N-acetylglucosamine transferase (SPINDLY family)|uniref:O-linked N-acetylglucosamine transferase, SPINDLY family protein n=1 Tax=Nodularia spumigena UHCC 0060 TaxID=3110300 RepID=A0ABU5UQQ9_NODSP|nr:O-linked N-acetylglucosamine transferase, SPINDLY family protein [Nodularia spumigena]MEA5526078.1 O-linked N-acetylglucosamine transferase, SPINDLY family protein [Nodularia spumigena UHCC 0143]MEA5608615.1 O-linked N-acetylglucosamine transferase, SPINDLY family protein [Nodularia spumigena UHCC 0060]MEA5612432.1 O-linked N-acetylglucosamine transferase, SPINDLY family protein [Nodularia spumigena UHCC 0040]
MTSLNSLSNTNDWNQQAEQYLIAKNYIASASLYEQAIEMEPDVKSHYWHLGLMLLLQGQETEAQMTWFMALSEAGDEGQDPAELLEILQTEAERRITLEDYQVAWVIRQHIREIYPENINNLLNLINLAIKLEVFNEDGANLLESITHPSFIQSKNYDPNLLLDVVKNILVYAPTEEFVINFVEGCIKYFPEALIIIEAVMSESVKISFFRKMPKLASRFAEVCLHRVPDNREVLTMSSYFYQACENYQQGLTTAKHCYEVVNTLAEKVCANALVLRALMSYGSYWEESCSRLKHQISLAEELSNENPDNCDDGTIGRLFSSLFFLPYIYDSAEKNRKIQNKISSLCQANIIKSKAEIFQTQKKLLSLRHQNKNRDKKVLNIGYVSHCFKRHSVGWLSRWIFQHHNQEKFKIHCYFIYDSDNMEQFTNNYFVNHSYKFHKIGVNDHQAWDQIQKDEIDILIDLDSITLDISCELMSIKAAPIQATWLGWDASGIPSIDYFIADPYVLPELAQDYYSETIWRLPQTYIAVDGFEVGIPNLRRENLDIPSDAIVYLMNQKGYKRHLEHLRLQMRIIKEVPNSYLLIKGDADSESSKEFFERIAEEEGVDFSQLRFLEAVPHEAVHRANLGIADVVLDTYPYNGATTTLETLWMGIPIVTRVGEQFAARNSYTMMINAGITEGIAWSEEEYVEWGVRLGKDEKLRQQISWKLRQGKKTAPLWNAEKFTRDMEKAYQQMWERYVTENGI